MLSNPLLCRASRSRRAAGLSRSRFFTSTLSFCNSCCSLMVYWEGRGRLGPCSMLDPKAAILGEEPLKALLLYIEDTTSPRQVPSRSLLPTLPIPNSNSPSPRLSSPPAPVWLLDSNTDLPRSPSRNSFLGPSLLYHLVLRSS